MAPRNRSRSRSREPSNWVVGTSFRIAGPNREWYPGKRGGWQPRFYLGWPDDHAPDDQPMSGPVTRDMVNVELGSIFQVKEIRSCREFVTVAVQRWTYNGVHLKINVQKGHKAWADLVEFAREPEV